MERAIGRAATTRACQARGDAARRARPGRRLGAGRVALAAALATAMLAVSAAGASAVIVQLASGKPLSYQPLRGAFALRVRPLASANLRYHGGPVMTSNTNYAFYWAPSGSPAYPAEYQSGVNRYLEDLAHDSGGDQNVDSVATQYANGGGEAVAYDSHFAGAIVDTDPYPANGCKKAPICLTDAQLQAELGSYITAHGLSCDLAHEYFLLTPPGVEDCFEASGTECSAGSKVPAYCAYHGSFASGGGEIVYANDPFVTGVAGCDDGEHPNEKPSDGALEGGLSHEHNESITDPELNAWYGPEGNENGDKCRTFEAASEFGTPLGTAPDGSRYNQLIDGREYWYQQEWSNEGRTCKQRLAAGVPQVSKLAPKTGPAAGGTSVTISGSGFALGAATTFKFASGLATSVNCSSTSVCTALSPPSAKAGTVDVKATVATFKSPRNAPADHFAYF